MGALKILEMRKKEICKWSKKELELHRDLLVRLVRSPSFLCAKCGRASAERKLLCKPRSLD